MNINEIVQSLNDVQIELASLRSVITRYRTALRHIQQITRDGTNSFLALHEIKSVVREALDGKD